MVLFDKKEECCGCSACKSICPVSAIQMLPDDEGFLYPSIDYSKCINCGKCKNICAFQNGYDTGNNLKEPLVYAVRHKDIREVETSRSGAMFIAVSDYILQNRGVVYGVGYTDHFRVVHKRATTKQERDEFKGSKYVQSDMNGTFELVKKDLQNGLMVLFSGTPCQTSGLYSYLRDINKEKLYVCDIVCHGVPSPFIWRDYLKYIEKKYKDKIVTFDFRDKNNGWESHTESFILQKKNKKITSKIFTNLFHRDIMLRPSCGVCRYTNLRRPADVTIGDYWGWQKISPSFNADNKGVSLVLVNTKRGHDLLNMIKKDITFIECSVDNCLQPNLKYPTKFSPLRECFWNDYKKYDFRYVVKKYSDLGWKNKFKKVAAFFKGKAKHLLRILSLC